MTDARSIIATLRDGGQPSADDLGWFARGLASGAVTEESIEEAGSFANALREGGVNAELLQNGLDVTLVSLEKYLAMSDAGPRSSTIRMVKVRVVNPPRRHAWQSPGSGITPPLSLT